MKTSLHGVYEDATIASLLRLYEYATIYIGENPEEEYTWLRKEVTLNGNALHLRVGGYPVVATIVIYNIPEEISHNRLVQKKIIKPTKRQVCSDIEPCLGGLEYIRGLWRAKAHSDKLYYEREDGGSAKLYDYTRDGIFGKIFQIGNTPIFELDKTMEDLKKKRKDSTLQKTRGWFLKEVQPKLRYIKKEDHKLPFVEGKSLLEALNTEISLYNELEPILREIE